MKKLIAGLLVVASCALVADAKVYFGQNGHIKGYVVDLKFDKKHLSWQYTLKGQDLSNRKLSNARFNYESKIALKNDLVYAVLKDGVAKDFFVIKPAQRKYKRTARLYKRKKIAYHKTNNIPLPKETSIRFD